MTHAERAKLKAKANAMARETAAKAGVPFHALLGPSRRPALAQIRWEIWWKCRHEIGIGRTVMGKLFNRNIQTVLHGIRRHEERMKAGDVGAA